MSPSAPERDRSAEGSTTRSTRAEPDFERLVRDALTHLYDVVYLQTHPLTALAGPDRVGSDAHRGQALRRALVDAIEGLRPAAGAPPGSESGRLHRLLDLRYVEALDIPTVRATLAIGRSTYFHEHARALEAVVSLLRERWGAADEAGAPARSPAHLRDPSGDGASRVVGTRTPPLPTPLTSFVGREREVAAVAGLLASERLVTLTGTGGVGKTRLALRVAGDLVDADPDGVRWVDLAPLADAALVPHAVLAALDLPDASGRPALDALTDYLRRRTLLLVLDNCEHLVAAAAALAHALTRDCPGLRVLATSREVLGVAGEAPWRVPSLAAPDPRRDEPIERLAAYEAVRLFAERARLVRPGFAVTAANGPAVARVCGRLDGIPLALELAAARARVLTVEQIAARLDESFGPTGGRLHLLTGGGRTALRRHQTLRGAIDWSHGLLSEAERVVLRRSSVFAGGWTLEAAEEVCADPAPTAAAKGGAGFGPDGDGHGRGPTSVAAGAVLDRLSGLADKSLLIADDVGDEERYRLLETIRQYAAERLREAGEETSTRDRHLAWCLALVERAEPELTGPRQLGWLDRLEAEQENLRAALSWATASGACEAGLRMGAVLGWVWSLRDRFAEGLRHLEALLERAAAAGAPPSPARALALAWAAFLAVTRGYADHGRAHALAEEALALGRGLGAPRAATRALIVLSWIAANRGDAAAARRRGEEAVAVARAAADPWATAQTILWLGIAVHFGGETAAAEPLLAEALALGRAVGDRYLVAHALEFLGVAAYFLGDRARARALLGESLATWDSLGSRGGVARDLRNLGRVALTEGDLAEATRLFGRSLALCREFGWDRAPVSLLDGFAGLAAARGEAARALRLAGAAAAAREAGDEQLWVGEVPELGRWLAPARSALSRDEAAAAWAEGQAMTLEQAVADAASDAAR